MNYIIFDNFHDNNGFIAEALRNNGIGIEEIYSPPGKYKCIAWVRGVFKTIRKSSANDTLIFWYDFQGIICFWACRLLLLKRRIIILNILLKNKSTLKNKVVSYLYKLPLQSNHVKATITSPEYGEMLNRQLKIKASYTLLHDAYPFCEKEANGYINHGKTVFCGGNNGRDWNLAIEIARLMQDVKFTFVMPATVHKYYLKRTLPDNVHVFSNIPLAEFNRLLQESSIVLLPLNTDAPAGLIVIFQAASQMKMVVTTSTPITKEYIDGQSGALCSYPAEQYAEAIRFHILHADIAEAKGRALHDKLKSECSKEVYTRKLYNIIVTL